VPSRLILVGDGPERGKVEQYCREHHICGSITFIGSFPLVEEGLGGADPFPLPPGGESFGLPPREAMSSGVPVSAPTPRGLPAADEAAAKALLSALEREMPNATHHCWAWRLGSPPRERGADAGEPAGTAGMPILQVLRGAGLSDVMAVVVRWYGGVKLGKGGL